MLFGHYLEIEDHIRVPKTTDEQLLLRLLLRGKIL